MQSISVSYDDIVNNPYILGQMIKDQRKKQGMSQKELALASDMSVRHLSDLENASKNVGIYSFFSVINILKMRLYYSETLPPYSLADYKEMRENEFRDAHS